MVVLVVAPNLRFCGAAGGEPARIVTETVSDVEAPRPSSAVSVKMMVVLEETSGAAKVADMEVALARAMSSAESWVHR